MNGLASHESVTTQWELITPEVAVAYLAKNTANRKAIPTHTYRMELDMRGGHWQATHEGIAFADTGELIDGQHRLAAIANTGISVSMLVTRGLPLKAIEAINRGKMRSLAHNLQILGYDHIDNRFSAIAKQMHAGPTVIKAMLITDAIIKEFIDLNLEAILFAHSISRKKVGPAAVAAALGRAYYHADIDRLRRFADAMADTIPRKEIQPGDASARALVKSVEHSLTTGWNAGASIYRKAQGSLRAYLDGRDISRICEVTADLFPLPAERTVQITQ